MIQSRPQTSIIIRAFNEERWLPEVFAALDIQTYRNFEVLVVDSGSIDHTRDIAMANGARIVRLRSEDFTFGYSLNIGIEQARGEFMAIISAHAIPTDAHWLERLVSPLRDKANAMVFGGQRGHAISKFSEARDFERIFPARAQVMDDDHVFVNNANSVIRKDLWEQHRFDEGLPGLEDAEWAKYWIPRNYRVLYEPSACVYHVHTESWAQVRHRFHREGIAGRWTAVRIMRHIPSEVSREIAWTLADFWLALRAGKLGELAAEISRYRYNKTIGIVKGILDSRVITNPSQRAELHFDKGFPAVVIRGPHSAAIEPRSIPTLKPGEVLVRVAYTGVSASDLEVFDGRTGSGRSNARYPIVPGRELSGTVVSLGKKVMNIQEGDRVAVESLQGCGVCAECKRDNVPACNERRQIGVGGADGGCAEFFVASARCTHKVPPGVSLSQAALTEPLAVVIKGLRRLGSSAADAIRRRCAVVGGGTVGYLVAKVLAARGHEVTVFDRDAARLKWFADPICTQQELAGLDRFEWLVDASGERETLAMLLQQSASGATVLLLGSSGGSYPLSFDARTGLDKSVIGSSGSGNADFKEALATLPTLDFAAMTQVAYPLEEFATAWSAARTQAHLKVMLRMDASAA